MGDLRSDPRLPSAAFCLARIYHSTMKRGAAVVLFLTGLPVFFFSGVIVPAPAFVAVSDREETQIQTDLERNLQTAQWMLLYDHIAWATTDLLLKEDKQTVKAISPVWFCLEKNHAWHAVYGHYGTNIFEITVCYRQVSVDKFEKVKAPDFSDRDRFARAISLTLPEIEDITRKTTVRFNYYVRREQERIAVYYVPAFQTDGKLAYGIQHTYFLDTTGKKILSHEQHGQVLIGALPNKSRTVILEMPDCVIPTPQAMFTMLSYRDYFSDILVHCQEGYFGMTVRNGVPRCLRTASLAVVK